jgi:hypothetical protein
MLVSVQTLLNSIIDYAGLFPPAKLSLERAIETYNQARSSPERWMLSHFILPISRLLEFEKLVAATEQHYSLSLILSKEWTSELSQLENRGSQISITALEFPLLSSSEIKDALTLIPDSIDSFFEIPFSIDIDSYLPIFKNSRSAVKIRTGGITPDLFPSIEKLNEFVTLFATHTISFKATAGLHHPLRGEYALTYETNGAIAPMYGFLNLAILSAFAYAQKITQAEGLEILQTTSGNDFQFTNDSIHWRDLSLSLTEIEKARQQFFRSFGSCSFQEPTEDLKTLKLLS